MRYIRCKMGTQIQSVQDYAGYIKCGEILKSPVQRYQDSFILKCVQCADAHFILESFITHVQEHFKDVLKLDESVAKTQYENAHEQEMESEEVGIDNAPVKFGEFEDPLFPIKCEIPGEETCERDEIRSQHSANSNEGRDMEQLDDFENASDTLDEFLPDDSETDDDEMMERPRNKRKNISKNEKKSNVSETDEEEIIKGPRSKRKKIAKDENKSSNSETDEDEISKESSNKRKTKLSPIVDNFMQSKNHVLTLIDFYKNQPELWNKYSPFYRLRDKRKLFFEEITQNLNKKCSLELTWSQTAEIISFMCGKHWSDLKKIQAQQTTKKKGKKSNKKQGNHEEKLNKKIERSWFFDELNFLRSKVVIHLQNLDTNLPDLTSEQIINILKIYQGFPHLWNTYLIENMCSNKRHDSLVDMLNVLETKMNLKTNTNALEHYICTIHNYFSREKKQRLEASTIDSKKNNASNYYEHMAFLEDHEGPFNCPECNRLYAKPLCFRLHKSQHDGTVPLICSQCKKEFKSVAAYTTHAKRHLEDLQFTCKECNMKFLRHCELKVHLLKHTDTKMYCCEICGASYRRSNSFRKHRRRHENRFSHTCHICSKGYYTKARYVDHMNSHMNIRSHICKICEKAFITSKALKTHAVTHEDARNHACTLCGKTFKLKIGVLQHMRTHGRKVETDDKIKIFYS